MLHEGDLSINEQIGEVFGWCKSLSSRSGVVFAANFDKVPKTYNSMKPVSDRMDSGVAMHSLSGAKHAMRNNGTGHTH